MTSEITNNVDVKNIDQYRVNWKTLTVEVIVQEFEQLVVLLREVGEVDEKPEKPNKRFKYFPVNVVH